LDDRCVFRSRYFYESRWLPGESVLAMAALPTNVTCNGTVLPPAVAVATDAGLSVLSPQASGPHLIPIILTSSSPHPHFILT